MRQYSNKNTPVHGRRKRMALMQQMNLKKSYTEGAKEKIQAKPDPETKNPESNNFPETIAENPTHDARDSNFTTNSPLTIQRAVDDEKDEDGDGDDNSSGKKSKLKPGNIVKNATRSIGRGVRNIGGNRDLVPMTNKQNRKAGIFFKYDAPNAALDEAGNIKIPKVEEEINSTKKKAQLNNEPTKPVQFSHEEIFNSRTVADFIKHKNGIINIKGKGEITWTTYGDFKPQKKEQILKFYSAIVTYDAVGDPDRFTLFNMSKRKKQIIKAQDPLTGSIISGRSDHGYSVTVDSYSNLTKLPDNSDWNYTIEMEVQAEVPYTHDLNGKKYPEKEKKGKNDSDETDDIEDVPDTDGSDLPEEPVKDNKRPWWHKYWYGEKLPTREAPKKDQQEE